MFENMIIKVITFFSDIGVWFTRNFLPHNPHTVKEKEPQIVGEFMTPPIEPVVTAKEFMQQSIETVSKAEEELKAKVAAEVKEVEEKIAEKVADVAEVVEETAKKVKRATRKKAKKEQED